MTPDEFDEELEASETNGESGETRKKDFIMKHSGLPFAPIAEECYFFFKYFKY